MMLMANESLTGPIDDEKHSIEELDWIRKFNWALSTISRASICYFMRPFRLKYFIDVGNMNQRALLDPIVRSKRDK